MIFRRRSLRDLCGLALCSSVILAGCGDHTSSSQNRSTKAKVGADGASAKSDSTVPGEGEANGAGGGSSRAVIQLIESIPTLPPVTSVKDGVRAVCGASDKADQKGFCPIQETVENGGMTFICTTQKYELAKVPEMFVAINPNADSLWPGSIIQSKSLINGILDPVPINERAAGSLTMTIATGSSGMFSAQLPRPSLATATEAIRQILTDNVSINTPAKFNYKMNRIYSKDQLAVALGINVETDVNFDISASFDFNKDDEKNRILVEFTQEYYTMAFSPEDGLKGFFRDTIEPGDLSPYTQEGNPLAYISSVTYGRKIYMLFESRYKMTDIEAALAASFQGYGVKVGADLAVHHNEVLSDASVRAYMIGGNAEDALEALTSEDNKGKALVNLKKLLTDGANFSRGNAGVPISYTVRHVKDSSQIKLQLATEYSARDCFPAMDIKKVSQWDLKVTLKSVDIAQEGGWCEPPLNDQGEFATCLNVQVGEAGTKVPVFCSTDIRKAKAGESLKFGDANHVATATVAQTVGQKVYISGSVREYDGSAFDQVLGFENLFELSPNYEWLGFKPDISVSGVFSGCKATLNYSLEWTNQR